MRFSLITFIIILSKSAICQNLVLNPGFEDTSMCIKITSIDCCTHWSGLEDSTPDYYFTGSIPGKSVPQNNRGFQDSRSGKAYGGAIMARPLNLEDKGVNEYLLGKLSRPLIADEYYYGEFHISLADKSAFMINKIGMHLTSHIEASKITPFPGGIFLFYDTVPQIESTSMLEDFTSWTKVNGIFQATGNEQNIIIGNFRANASDEYDFISIPGVSSSGYYYVEDVAVIHLEVELPSFVELCFGDEIILDASVDSILNANYQWNTGNSNPIITVDSSGVYIVEIEINDQILRDTVVVKVVPDSMTLGPDTSLCQEDQLILHLDSSFKHIEWNTFDTANILQITEPGSYHVSATNKCGSFEAGINVEFNDCNCRHYIPNAFSPNGDNINDMFVVNLNCEFAKIEELDVQIFNRWGEHIFKSSSDNKEWNGHDLNGSICPSGVYAYVVNIKILKPNGNVEHEILSGDVTIIY